MSNFADFLSEQDLIILSQQQRHTERLFFIILKLRARVVDQLMSEPLGNSRRQLINTLRKLDALIKELQVELKDEFVGIIEEAAGLGVTQQVELIEKYYNEIKNPAPESIGAIEASVLKEFEVNLDTTLASFAADLKLKISTIIHEGFIHGRNESDVVNSIIERFKTQYGTTLRTVHHVYQTAYNAANHQTLVELSVADDRIEKQWWSLVDSKTTQPCLNLHEQIKPVSQPFVEPASGAEFMYPPAVFAPGLDPMFHLCRSRAIPYTPYSGVR